MVPRLFCLVGILAVAEGCFRSNSPEVIVYSALDREFAEPILHEFTRETGIRVRARYDSESTKTVQLVNAIVAESKARTRCDVFWNNEVIQTMRLDQQHLLEPFTPQQAPYFSDAHRSKDHSWHGFAARARVLLVNRDVVDRTDWPTSIFDLIDPRWKGRVAIAKPLFGTTATHAACLVETLGVDAARKLLEEISCNAQVLSGNKQVAEGVARGNLAFGLTDTDDAIIEIEKGFPVEIVFPDQGTNECGTLVIPNTLAIMKHCPHPIEARKLVDFLLSAEVETQLSASASAQIPLHRGVSVGSRVFSAQTIKTMNVDWENTSKGWSATVELLNNAITRHQGN